MAPTKYASLNLWEKMVIRHAHPVSFILNALGLIWAGYFLWLHRWYWALLCFGILSAGGLGLGAIDKSYLIQSRSQLNSFQTLLVFHANPFNLVLHLIALALFVLGAWKHSAPFLLGALSFVLLGHIFPWLYHRKKDQLFTLMMDEDVSLSEED